MQAFVSASPGLKMSLILSHNFIVNLWLTLTHNAHLLKGPVRTIYQDLVAECGRNGIWMRAGRPGTLPPPLFVLKQPL